jgi:hypothetical protein
MPAARIPAIILAAPDELGFLDGCEAIGRLFNRRLTGEGRSLRDGNHRAPG